MGANSIEVKIGSWMRFSWSGIWAGLLVGLAAHIVLAGLGAGLAASSPEADLGPPTWLWIWTGLSWVVATFLAGYTAVWVAGAVQYPEAFFGSFVTWGFLTTVQSLFLLTTVMPAEGGPIADVRNLMFWLFASGVTGFLTTILGGVTARRAIQRYQARIAAEPAGVYREAS